MDMNVTSTTPAASSSWQQPQREVIVPDAVVPSAHVGDHLPAALMVVASRPVAIGRRHPRDLPIDLGTRDELEHRRANRSRARHRYDETAQAGVVTVHDLGAA